jgi:hypothetical protein
MSQKYSITGVIESKCLDLSEKGSKGVSGVHVIRLQKGTLQYVSTDRHLLCVLFFSFLAK